ncbi:MAG: PIN domain-containing protein [Acidobacteria bacterium]|nr:PIN domain-containing protein [Acidobacteriota bacterium]
MSVERVFFDTNVLVYANDESEPDKSLKARELIRHHLKEGNGCLSAQVLCEFWVTVTRKMAVPLPLDLAERQVRLLGTFQVVGLDALSVWRAIDLQKQHTLSFWDAHILAAALLGGCGTLFSEDFQDGAAYSGVRVVNPFKVSPETPGESFAMPPSSGPENPLGR